MVIGQQRPIKLPTLPATDSGSRDAAYRLGTRLGLSDRYGHGIRSRGFRHFLLAPAATPKYQAPTAGNHYYLSSVSNALDSAGRVVPFFQRQTLAFGRRGAITQQAYRRSKSPPILVSICVRRPSYISNIRDCPPLCACSILTGSKPTMSCLISSSSGVP